MPDPADDNGRRSFLVQFGCLLGTGLLFISGCTDLFPTQPEENSISRRREDPRDRRSQSFSLRQLLEAHFAGAWQAWNCSGITGEGVWQIQTDLVVIDQGLCHIRRNGQILAGQGAYNLDNLFFWSGETVSLTSLGGQPYWELQIPWLPAEIPAVLD